MPRELTTETIDNRRNLARLDEEEGLEHISTLGEYEMNRHLFKNATVAIRKRMRIILKQLDFDKRFEVRRRYCLVQGHQRVAAEDNLYNCNNPTALALMDILDELCEKAGVHLE